jgi:hypothetical protein
MPKLNKREKSLIAAIIIIVAFAAILWAASWTSYPDQSTIAAADTFLFMDSDDATAAKLNEITWAQLLAEIAGRSLSVSTDIIDIDAELYTDTKCIYIEDPTAADDLPSIWANKTAAAFTLTEMWCESDQTIDFDLQIDDGSPADVDGTDLQCAAGEAEDTSLGGDTELAAGEELDLVVTSVANTPTWVSICWTYTIND